MKQTDIKINRVKKGTYTIQYKNETFELISCDLIKSWTVYGFGNRMISGGDTKKEAIDHFSIIKRPEVKGQLINIINWLKK